ncbi:MAG: N-methyl-L-tryptophan oxidase [Phycisphaerales bacterium]
MTDARPSAITLGLGTMGAATCLELARRGVRVIGIDRFAPPHAFGSHHGGSRIVRDCYFEHPDYVPLLLRAREGWARLERDARAAGALREGPLVHRPGVLYMGHAGSDVVDRSAASGETNGIACERLTPRDVRARFPQFEMPTDWRALFEPGAGFVRPERAVAAALDLARGLGAEIRTGERVLDWSETASGIRVQTDRATLDADTLVIAAGAWTPTLAAQLGVPLVPQRVVIAWLTPRDPAVCAAPRMPVWYVDRPGAPGLYGIPTAPDQGDPPGVKVAFHAGTPCDPDAPRMPPTDRELRALADATAEFVPAAAGSVAASATCLYTMSPDGHFIVDRMPGCTRTWIACGFSGHGFKFMPVMGEALADLATTGTTRLPIEFLRIRR